MPSTRFCFVSAPKKKNLTTTSTKKSTKQADAFSLPDDENENNDDDSEFVYEKITLLTADGVVVRKA